MVPVASESDLDLLKGRIVSLKAEIRREQGTTGQGSGPDESPATKVNSYTEFFKLCFRPVWNNVMGSLCSGMNEGQWGEWREENKKSKILSAVSIIIIIEKKLNGVF